jgi:hypothetical protein
MLNIAQPLSGTNGRFDRLNPGHHLVLRFSWRQGGIVAIRKMVADGRSEEQRQPA